MSHIGHPIIGDELYNSNTKNAGGQLLAAIQLGFVHPITQKIMNFQINLPDFFKEWLQS
jgi:23S rRNA pseudouridine1911/1915/1917 synthase